MKLLEGKVAVITGGAKGLGRAFAMAFAEEGARLALSDIDVEGVRKTAEEISAKGSECIWFRADVTDAEGLKGMAQATVEKFGRIDVLVNNAGYYFGVERKAFTAITVEEWDRMMAINVKGPWLCTKAVYPYMKAQGKGKIVNISSETCFTGSNGFVHYVASKGGVLGLTRALAAEWGRTTSPSTRWPPVSRTPRPAGPSPT